MWPTTLFVCTYIWHSFNSKSIFKKAGISCLNIFFFICISLPKNRWKELKLFERWNSWQIKSVGFSLSIDRVLKTISELHEFVIESEGFWIYSSASNGRWKGTQERDNGRVSQTCKRQGTKAMANYSWPTENGQWPLGLPYWPSDQGLVQRLIRGLPNPEITSIACKSWLNLHMYSWW